MECKKIQNQLPHYLYGELSENELPEVEEHLKACLLCRQEWESLQDTHRALQVWEDIAPQPGLRHRVLARISQEELSKEVYTKEEVALGEYFFRGIWSMIWGVLAAVVLFCTLDQRLVGGSFPSFFLPLCSIYWAGALTLLFFLAFNSGKSLILKLGEKEILLNLRLIASTILVAIAAAYAFAIIMLYISPTFPLSSTKIPVPILYLFIEGILTLMALFLGSFFFSKGLEINPLLHGMVAGLGFFLVVAPGITAFCLPLTLGLYSALLTGTVIGAVSGGALGCWLAICQQPT